jgi:hypothetical protein
MNAERELRKRRRSLIITGILASFLLVSALIDSVHDHYAAATYHLIFAWFLVWLEINLSN